MILSATGATAGPGTAVVCDTLLAPPRDLGTNRVGWGWRGQGLDFSLGACSRVSHQLLERSPCLAGQVLATLHTAWGDQVGMPLSRAILPVPTPAG